MSGISFCVATPIIALFALSAVVLSWLVFRYQSLNLWVPVYDGYATIWPSFFSTTVFTLGCTHVIMGAFLITKSSYIAGALLIVLGPLACREFHHHVNRKYNDSASVIPLETAKQQPHVNISPDEFLQSALKSNGDEVWHPEVDKCWQGSFVPLLRDSAFCCRHLVLNSHLQATRLVCWRCNCYAGVCAPRFGP